jgi:hypothetical protein
VSPDQELSGVIVSADAGAETTRIMLELAGGTAEHAVVLAGPDTAMVVEGANGATRRGGPADLRPGARIRTRHTGVVMRSLPPQYNAVEIRVLPGS